jgi:hypothetical protein
MLLIGLGHRARQGKDTFASVAAERFGDQMLIRRVSFADPLRQEVRDAAQELFAKTYPTTPFDGNEAMRLLCQRDGVEFDEHAIPDEDYPWGKQRKYHQWYGTDYRRAQDPEYWTKKGQEQIRLARRQGVESLMFRDMRFPNEYFLTEEEKGWCIKIMRLGWVSDVPEHVSEFALDEHEFHLRIGVMDGQYELLKDLSADTFKRLARL